MLMKSVEDLIKEICSLAKLSHPNIVAFLGFTYTTPDDLKCVTEFMDGGNLRKLLDNPKRELTWATEKLSIALDVAMALAYLHELKPKILHRNIKADKVLLSSTLEAKLSGYPAFLPYFMYITRIAGLARRASGATSTP